MLDAGYASDRSGLPGTASLGVHYTRDLAGQGKFGPDVEWVDTLDYRVDPRRADGCQIAAIDIDQIEALRALTHL